MFTGSIDNARIYNAALSQSQIATDMTTPVMPKAPSGLVSGPVSGPVSSGPSATVVPNTAIMGLVATYSSDEGTGTTLNDSSFNNNAGTIANATWAAGESGSALNFTGDTTSSVMIPDAASLHLTKGMTLEAWVNPATLAGHGNNGAAVIAKDFMIPSKHNKFSDKDPISYALYASDGNNKPPAVHILVGGTDYEVKGTSKISTNQWTFLAATFDGTTLSLYVNGTLAGSQTIQGTILNSTDPLRIGGDWAGEMFTGLIDNVRISRMALPQSEILIDMNAPVISVQDPEGGSEGTGGPQIRSSGNNVTSARGNSTSASAGPVFLDALKPSESLSLRLRPGGATTVQPTKTPVVFSALGWKSRAKILMGWKPQFQSQSLFSEGS